MNATLPLNQAPPSLWVKTGCLALLTLLMMGLRPTGAEAQITLYNYTNASNGVPASVASGLTGTNLTIPAFPPLSGGDCPGPGQGFGTDGWPTTNTFDVDAFNAANEYVTFTLTPTGMNNLLITGFTANSRRDNQTGTADDGPASLRYAYSKTGLPGSWTSVNPGNPQASNNCSSVGVQRIWNSFPTVTVTSGQSITFRVYGLSSGSNFTGDLYLRNVVVSGFVCSGTPSATLTPQSACIGTATKDIPSTASTTDIVSYSLSFSPAGIPTISGTLVTPGTLPSPLTANTSGASAGTYTGTLTLTNSCGITTTTAIPALLTINPLPVAGISVSESSGVAPNDGIICPGGSATLNASGGGTYLWSTGETSSSISVSPAATTSYSVTVTTLGCTASSSTTITVTAPETANAGPDQSTCQDGIVLISGTVGGTAPGGSWSDNGAGGSFAPLGPPLTYFYTPAPMHPAMITLTLTTNGPCPVSDDLVVTYGNIPPLTLSTSGPSTATCGDMVTITVKAENGFVDMSSLQYSINWNPSSFSYVSNSATAIGGGTPGIGLANIASGQLTYVWADPSGYDGEDLADGATLLTITLKVLNATGLESVDITNNTTSIEATNAQFCDLTVDLENNADISLQPIPVSLTLTESSGTTPNDGVTCAGAPVVLTASGGATYAWSPGGGTTASITVSPTETTDYTVTVTNAIGCTASATQTITVNPRPDSYITIDPTEICIGGSTTFTFHESNYLFGTEFTLSATATDDNGTNPVSYSAVVDGDDVTWTDGVEFNGDLTISDITVSNPATACSSTISGFNVDVLPEPTLAFTAQVTGDDPQSGSSDGNPVVTIDFCEGEFFSFTNYSTNLPNVGFLENLSGTGNVTYNGGTVTFPQPEIDYQPGALPGFFSNGGNPYGPYGLSSLTYGNFVQTYTPYLDTDNSGDYTPGDCLGDPITLVYNVYANPVASIAVTENSGTPNDNTICSGASATLTASGGTSYSWSTGATTAAITVSPTFTTTYTVTVTSNGCSSSAMQVIFVNPMPSLSATINGVTVTSNNDGQDDTGAFSLCNGGTNNIVVNAFSDVTGSPGNIKAYQTIVANNVTSPFCNNCAALVTAFPASTGTVALINTNLPGTLVISFRIFADLNNNDIIDADECPNDWVVYTITVNPIPTAAIAVIESSGTTSDDGVICTGASATLTASGGTSYLWSTGATTAAITVSPTSTTTYSVTVTASNCSSSTSQVITVNPLPTVNQPTNQTVCHNTSTAAVTFTSIVPGTVFNWTNDQTGIGLAASGTGNIGSFTAVNLTGTPIVANITVTPSANGCDGTPVTFTITVEPQLNLTITQNVTNICSGGLIDYTITTTVTTGITFNLVLEQGINPGNPKDLSTENTLPQTLTGLTVSASSPYHFTQTIYNQLGAFDKGRVRIRATNIKLTNTPPTCTLANVTGAFTQVYPKPRLVAPADQNICTGTSTSLDVDLDGIPSASNSAGYPVRIEWTVVAGPDISGASNGFVNIYDATGVEIPHVGGDIAQTLTNSGAAPETVVYTITPRASGPTNPFNADDCYGDPITVTVTVNPTPTPSISGPTVVHAGALMQLFGNPGITPPSNLAGETWLSSNNGIAMVDNTGVVSGVTPGGPVTITYQVTDNAGCTATATYLVTVLPALKLTAMPTVSEITCGGTFDVNITADNFADLFDLQYSINWNPAQLQLLSNTSVAIGGDLPVVGSGPGDLTYSWSALGGPQTLPNGTVIMTLSFKVVTNSGLANISITGTPTPINADNSSFSPVPVTTMDGAVTIDPIAIVLGTPSEICPVACPAFTTVTFPILATTGNPDTYSIDWNVAANTAGFADITTASLDLIGGQIIVLVPCGLTGGTYSGQLVVTNSETGCSSVNYSITVFIDQTPPSISLAQGTLSAYDCPDDVPAAIPAPVITSDNCPGQVSVTLNSESQTGTGCPGNPLTITRVYKATDAAGNMAFLTHVIVVLDQDAPEIDESEYVNGCYDTEQEAIDAVLAYAEAHKSDNCSSGNGIAISFFDIFYDELSCGATVQITATDACGNEASFDFNVVIDGEAPVIDENLVGLIDDCYEESETGDPLQNAYDAAIQLTQLAASDNCTHPEDLTFSAVAIDPNNRCNLTIVVTVTDECGKTATRSFNTRVDATPPVIQNGNPLALSGMCFETEEDAIAAAISITHALDNCPNPIQYDGEVDQLATCPYTVVVTATDFCGNFTTILYENVFIDNEGPEVVDETPEITCFHTSQEAIDYALSITTWSDNCTALEDLDVETAYSNANDPDPNDGCEMGTVTITVTDHCGWSNAVSYDVTIDNTPPTAEPLADLTVSCFDEIDLQEVNIIATDNCGGSVTVTGHEDGPIDEDCSFRRTYFLEDACGNEGYVIQTIIVNDSEAPVWETEINPDTLYAACNDEQALYDALHANPPVVTDNCEVVDVVLVTGDPVYSPECNYNYTITQTWTAYDQCGNSSTFTRVTLVSDTQAPTFDPNCQFMPLNLYTSNEAGYTVTCPADATISLEVDQVIDNATGWTVGGVSIPGLGNCIADNCSEVSEIEIRVADIVYDDSELPCHRTITVSFELSDACGNVQEEPFVCTYDIYDNTAPGLEPNQVNLNRQVSCSDAIALAAAQSLEPGVVDNCDPEAHAVKTSGDFVPGDCAGEGTYTNTWTAIDACENESEVLFTQVISLFDHEPPTFDPGCQFMPLNIYTSENESIECPENATTSLYIGEIIGVNTPWIVAGHNVPSMVGCVSDNCSATEQILVSVENIVSQYDPQTCSRTITISFRLTDDCGNEQPTLFVCIYHIIDDVHPNVEQGSISSCYHTVAEAQAAAIAATGYSDNCTATENLVVSATTDGTCSAVVTVTVTDCAGNSTSVQYNTRIDNTPPTVIAGTIASSYPSVAAAQAAAQGATTYSDNCPGPLSLSIHTVGTCQAIVTVTVTDGCGNSSSVSYLTSIIQNPLAVSCPGNATRNASANCNYTVSGTEFDPTISGGCGIGSVKYQLGAAAPVTASTLAGVVLPKGTTTVTWTVTDINGNTAACSFTVTVNDVTAPTIACPANIVKNNDNGLCSAVVTYSVTASDNCMFTLTQTGGLASGAAFPVGTTTNAFMVTDMSGNSTACQFTVTVNDTQAPTIVCPGAATRSTSLNACTYTVSGTEFNPTVSDNCAVSTTSYTLGGASSGSGSSTLAGVTLNKGTTTVLWTVTDTHGNTAACSFNVVVNDGQAPAIVCPPSITVNADGGGCTAVVSLGTLGTATATDNCPGAITITNTGIPQGNIYSGTTTIVWKATDAAGNTSTCTQTVTVHDAQNPTLTCPVNASATRSTNVNDCFYTTVGAEFNATGSDNCGAPTITYSLSGATTGTGSSLTGVNLNKGLTTVTWKATDGGGNMVTCSFTVQVNDTRPPVVSCPPNVTVNAAANACNAVVNPGTLGASDNCGAPTTTFGPIPMGNLFPVGTTTLTGTASDNNGNTAICTMTVKVVDVTAPVFTKCPPNITLQAVEGTCTGVMGNNGVPEITDNCVYSLTWALSGATTGTGSGSVPPTQVFQTGTTTVTYTATDVSGNTAVCSFTVSVNCIKVSGTIIWEHNRLTNPIPVKNATVRLTSSAMPPMPSSPMSTMTDVNGMYMFTISLGKDLIITPTKPALNTAQKLDGVTAADAAVIQAHVAGTTLITDPYKMVAADVNHTNTITTVDASIITSALMGNPIALAAFDTSWRFIRTSYSLPMPPWPGLAGNNRIVVPGNIGADLPNQDFVGIKIGNVNGSPAPVFSPSSPLIWLVQDETLQANQEIDAVFTAAQFSNLVAYQFALDFDPTQLQLLDVQPLGNLSLNLTDNFGTYNAANGEIRAAWSNATGTTLNAGTPVFKVRFKALSNGAKLSELLHLNDEVLAGKAFNTAMTESNVVLSFNDQSATATLEPQEGKVQLLQNRPNPFTEETTIGFILPEACEAQLRVFDMSGREITTYRRQYDAGYHEIVFRVSNASDYGVMYYELTTPSGRLVRKMISTGK